MGWGGSTAQQLRARLLGGCLWPPSLFRSLQDMIGSCQKWLPVAAGRSPSHTGSASADTEGAALTDSPAPASGQRSSEVKEQRPLSLEESSVATTSLQTTVLHTPPWHSWVSAGKPIRPSASDAQVPGSPPRSSAHFQLLLRPGSSSPAACLTLSPPPPRTPPQLLLCIAPVPFQSRNGRESGSSSRGPRPKHRLAARVNHPRGQSLTSPWRPGRRQGKVRAGSCPPGQDSPSSPPLPACGALRAAHRARWVRARAEHAGCGPVRGPEEGAWPSLAAPGRAWQRPATAAPPRATPPPRLGGCGRAALLALPRVAGRSPPPGGPEAPRWPVAEPERTAQAARSRRAGLPLAPARPGARQPRN